MRKKMKKVVGKMEYPLAKNAFAYSKKIQEHRLHVQF
jgi:hypothetical protein